jgi:hypothetical protein
MRCKEYGFYSVFLNGCCCLSSGGSLLGLNGRFVEDAIAASVEGAQAAGAIGGNHAGDKSCTHAKHHAGYGYFSRLTGLPQLLEENDSRRRCVNYACSLISHALYGHFSGLTMFV